MAFMNMYALGTQVSLISDVFRSLSFFLDGIIYSLIPAVYSLIYSLYDFSILFEDGALLTNLVNRVTTTVYSFLAIFMFFRVAFSLITMLVDPSVIDDKEKGAKKIVLNIMICLILIVAVPKVFEYAKLVQSKAMSDHWIEKVVFGDEFGEINEDYSLGNELALSVWGVFLSPFDANSATLSAYNSLFNNQGATGFGKVWPLTKVGAVLNSVTGIPVIADIVGRVEIANNVLNSLFDAGTYYQLSYIYILSTIVGVYVLWTFIKMMVDVAYRSIKFFALELLAPVAIVSYIEPSSSKKGVFNKWLNETVKTYISLFIRVFVFAFASVLLRAFSLSTVKLDNGVWVNLFYILAVIAFIKTAPKFIDNLFGTSISKESESNLGSALKSVLGFAGMAVGGVAGGISNAVVAKKAGKTGWGLVGAGVKGAWAGGSKGMAAGKKGGVGGMVGVVTNAYGTYGDAKKAYGLNIDPEMEKLTNQWEKRVPEVDAAKKKAIANLEENDNAKYKQILQTGTSVNGRKYGRGLENDEGLVNLIKKNDAGLAADEIKHEGDSEFLMLRNLVHDAKQSDAIVQRTLANAKSDYEFANAAYNSAIDRGAYTISFEMGTANMNYSGLNDNDLGKALMDEYDKLIQNSRLDESQKAQITLEYKDRLQEFKSANSHEDRLNIVLEQTQDRITYETSSLSASELDDRFDKANKERIISVYGNSLANIESDAAKSSGDAKAADDALKSYVNGRGKKAKDIDAAYALADSRHKAKKLEEKRNKDNNN